MSPAIRTHLREALVAVALAAALGGLLYLAGTSVLNLRVPYPLYVVLVLAVIAGRRVVVAVQPPAVLESPIREDTDVRAFGLPDRPFADVRRWEERLELVRGDPDYFRRVVVPALAELVDERLRSAHGITRTTDPDRARALMGPRLWDLLGPAPTPARTPASASATSASGSAPATPASGSAASASASGVGEGGSPPGRNRAPSPADLAAVVEEMEELWTSRH